MYFPMHSTKMTDQVSKQCRNSQGLLSPKIISPESKHMSELQNHYVAIKHLDMQLPFLLLLYSSKWEILTNLMSG